MKTFSFTNRSDREFRKDFESIDQAKDFAARKGYRFGKEVDRADEGTAAKDSKVEVPVSPQSDLDSEDVSQYEAMTVADLKEFARARGVKLIKNATKKEIIHAITESR